MIIIDEKIISEDILENHFNCNLSKCKGQCCVEGVCGAPLEEEEKVEIDNLFELIKDKLTNEAIETINKNGKYIYLKEHGLVTPTIGTGEGICVYAIKNDKGVVLCAFEQYFYEKKSKWKKPISCHLFPIRITKSEIYDLLNYEKIDICKSGCSLGEKNQTKLYVFLKEAIIRKFGKEFYNTLIKLGKTKFKKIS